MEQERTRMAMRHFWFFIGLVLAGLGAGFVPDIVPDLLDRFASGVLPATYVDSFNNHTLLRIANALAASGLLIFLLVFAGLALLDGLGIMLARRRLQEEQEFDTGSLEPEAFTRIIARHTPFEAMARAHSHRLQVSNGTTGKAGRKNSRYTAEMSADSALSAQHTVDPFLYRWFFDPLPGLLAGTGAVMLGLSLLWALDPASSSITLATLRPGLIALVILSAAALAIAVLKRGILVLRHQQADQLCSDIDRLYPPIATGSQISDLQASSQTASADLVNAVSNLSTDLSETIDAKLKDWLKASETANQTLEKNIVSGIEDALREPMNRLSEATERSTEAQVEQSREALEAVLNSFLTGLDTHLGERMQTFNTALAETQKAAESMSESYKQSLEEYRQLTAQDLGAHAESFERTAANFEALQGVLENLITLVSPMLRQIVDNQESLLNAMDQEASASKVIGRAATELSTAAQASRETVERFITLAERLREANKTLGASANGGIDPGTINELRALKTSFLEDTSSSEE